MSFFSAEIWRKVFKIKTSKQLNAAIGKEIDTTLYSRKSNIPLCFRDYTVNIHKGAHTRQLELNQYHINSKFGEYAYTRKLYYYPLKKKNRR